MAVSATRVRLSLAVFLTVIATVVSLSSAPAYADPDNEGCVNASLCAKLESAAVGYYDIQVKLTASQQRQAQIHKALQEAELGLVRLNAEISTIAADRYKSGQMGMINQFLLSKGSTSELLQGAAVSEYLAWRDDEDLRRFRETRDEADKQRALLAAEVENEQKQLKELDKQMRTAEKALAALGGIVSAGYSGPAAKTAQPAERNADGSFPRESCSLPDPTGGQCVTPRMVHTINQVKFGGFRRTTIGCWRYQSWGEHPKGRACDFMVTNGTVATGANKRYGTELALWAIKNAQSLGIMYVIWFRQIWMPGIGWRSYVGASDHTDHVHISVL